MTEHTNASELPGAAAGVLDDGVARVGRRRARSAPSTMASAMRSLYEPVGLCGLELDPDLGHPGLDEARDADDRGVPDGIEDGGTFLGDGEFVHGGPFAGAGEDGFRPSLAGRGPVEALGLVQAERPRVAAVDRERDGLERRLAQVRTPQRSSWRPSRGPGGPGRTPMVQISPRAPRAAVRQPLGSVAQNPTSSPDSVLERGAGPRPRTGRRPVRPAIAVRVELERRRVVGERGVEQGDPGPDVARPIDRPRRIPSGQAGAAERDAGVSSRSHSTEWSANPVAARKACAASSSGSRPMSRFGRPRSRSISGRLDERAADPSRRCAGLDDQVLNSGEHEPDAGPPANVRAPTMVAARTAA